jgi:outer membrane autotransporter protein
MPPWRWQPSPGTTTRSMPAALERLTRGAFQGSAAPFTVAGVPLARDAALVEIGLDALIASQTTIGISYTGQLAEHLQDHSVKGNLRVRF